MDWGEHRQAHEDARLFLSKKSVDSSYNIGTKYSFIVHIKNGGNVLCSHILNIPIPHDSPKGITLPTYHDLFYSHPIAQINNGDVITKLSKKFKPNWNNLHPHLDPYLGGYNLAQWHVNNGNVGAWGNHVFGQCGNGWGEYIRNGCLPPKRGDLILFFGIFHEYEYDTQTQNLTQVSKYPKYYIYGYFFVDCMWGSNALCSPTVATQCTTTPYGWLKGFHPHCDERIFSNPTPQTANNHIFSASKSGIFDYNHLLWLTHQNTNNLNPCIVPNSPTNPLHNPSCFEVFDNKNGRKDNSHMGSKVNNSLLFNFTKGHGQEYLVKNNYVGYFDQILKLIP